MDEEIQDRLVFLKDEGDWLEYKDPVTDTIWVVPVVTRKLWYHAHEK